MTLPTKSPEPTMGDRTATFAARVARFLLRLLFVLMVGLGLGLGARRSPGSPERDPRAPRGARDRRGGHGDGPGGSRGEPRRRRVACSESGAPPGNDFRPGGAHSPPPAAGPRKSRIKRGGH